MEEDPSLRTTSAPTRRSSPGGRATTAELRIVMPPGLVATLPLGRGRVTLGRRPDDTGGAAIVVPHESVSRTQFALDWDARGGFHTAIDLGSSFGTYVDAMRAVTPLVLADGAVIRLGPSVVMVYQSPATADGDEAQIEDASREAIPGQAPALRALRAAVATIARDPSPLLLVGETGTGKELVADALHASPERAPGAVRRASTARR